MRLILLLSGLLFAGLGFGQTEIFNLAGGGAFPAGWVGTNNVSSNAIDRGSYYLLEAGNPGDVIESATYDLSTYTSATFDVDITSFGSESHNALKVEISINGGSTYTQTEITNITTSSYIGITTINLSAVSSQVKLRFTNNGTSGRGIRMQDLVLTASGTATFNDLTTEVYDAPPTQPAAGSIASTDDTAGEAVDVFAFTIEDQGSGDGLATQVTNIRVKPHTTNTADWTDNIQGVQLNGGAITTGIPIISDTEINIPITAGDLDIADGGSTAITLSVFLNTSGIEDNAIFSCFVDADDHGFTADASGSSFISEFTLGDFNSNDFDIEIDASVFVFQQQPSNGTTGNALTPAVTVAAQDENGNIDTDYNLTIPLSTTGAFDGSSTTTVTPVNGIATFSNLVFNATGTGLTITALATNDGTFVTTDVSSTTFDIVEPVTIVISRVADPGDDFNGRFVEIKNIGFVSQDISGWSIKRYVNSNTSPETNLIDGGAVLEAGATYIVGGSGYSGAFDCLPDESSSIISGNGDDTYALFNDSDELIDIYGEIGTDGTGEDWEYADAIAIRSNTVTAASTVWLASEWTISGADIADIDISCPVPANDECANATVVTCGTSLLNETTSGSTDNGDDTGCSYGKGVWYSFEGTDQEVTVIADGSNGDFDLGISVSTSTDCTAFNNIDCVDGFFGTSSEEVTFFANSGTTYYFYVAYFDNTSTAIGTFDLSVSCANVAIAQTTTGSCYSADDISSTGSGNWLNILDASGDIAASILDAEVMGTITTDIFINTAAVRTAGNGISYLDRNLTITPATQPTGNITVRLYLTTAEYNALVAADSDIMSIGDINITKTDGNCSDAFSGPGTFISQAASGTLSAGFFVEVEVSSFSTFFLQEGAVALPVEITSFTAKPQAQTTLLNFSTATEQNNSHFLIQRSADGQAFETIGQVVGKGDSNQQVDYEYTDTKPLAGLSYYRLQQFDYDGTFAYYGPVAVRFGESTEAPNIWPVPTRDRLQVELPTGSTEMWLLEVYDLNGRRVIQQQVEEKNTITSLDLSNFAAGSYYLRWTNGQQSGQQRFMKQ